MLGKRVKEVFLIQSFRRLSDSIAFSNQCIQNGYRPIVVLPYDEGRLSPELLETNVEVLLTNPGQGYESAQMIRDVLCKQEGWKTPEPVRKTYRIQEDVIGFYELKISCDHETVVSDRPITLYRDVCKWIASFNLMGETHLNERCASFLYRKLNADDFSKDKDFDVIACAEAKAMQMTQILSGMFHETRHVVLRKSVKNYMPQRPREPMVEEFESITTRGKQQLVLDPNDEPWIRGKRVLLVDDVVATGGTIRAAARLIQKASGEVVRVETVLLKGEHPGLKNFGCLKTALL